MHSLGVTRAEFGALVAVVLMATLGLFVSPLMIGVWVDGQAFAPTDAGALVTLELLLSAATSMWLSGRVNRIPTNRWLSLSLSLVAIANLSCALVESYGGLVSLRLLAGFGGGIAYGIFGATVASTPTPERLFAFISICQSILISALLVLLPMSQNQWGGQSIFLGLGLTGFLALLAVRAFPQIETPTAAGSGKLVLSPAAGLLLLGALLLAIIVMGIWAFSQQLGATSGLDDGQIGLVLGSATLAGLVGAGLAGILGVAFGRTWPILLGVLTMTLSMVALTGWPSAAVFIVAQIGWAVSYYFLNPYILGLGAALDQHGRWAAAVAGIVNLGAALGPLIFAMLYQFVWIPWLLALVGIVSLGLLLTSVRLSQRSAS